MTDLNQKMLLIKSICNDASIVFSEWTGQWYVDAMIEIGDGFILTGFTEHRDTPEEAVLAYFERLKAVNMADVEHYIAVSRGGNRKEYRWNGAAFIDVTREGLHRVG